MSFDIDARGTRGVSDVSMRREKMGLWLNTMKFTLLFALVGIIPRDEPQQGIWGNHRSIMEVCLTQPRFRTFQIASGEMQARIVISSPACKRYFFVAKTMFYIKSILGNEICKRIDHAGPDPHKANPPDW
jgi:hypothetical protein